MSYPRSTYPSGLAAGTELSPAPTQGGSLITLNEASVVAPSNPPTVGQVAIAGALTGVVVKAPAANNADCVIQTSGVFSLPVVASDDGGVDAVAVGDAIYVTNATGVLSKDGTTGHTLFGYALAASGASASAALIPVKLKTV